MISPDINIDWFLEEGRDLVRFKVDAFFGDRRNSLEFRIRLSLVSPIERPQLLPILNRQESVDGSVIARLLYISLRQQHPEYSEQDRQAELRKLLSSCWLRPSIKETAVQLQGQKILTRQLQCGADYYDYYEGSKLVRQFDQICQSQRTAARNLDFGMPRLRTVSPADAEEMELYFCELKHGDAGEANRKHQPLLTRLSGSTALARAIGKVTLERQKPASFWFALKYQLVCSWTHGFLWGFNNTERPKVLFYFCGMPGQPMNERQLAQIDRERVPVDQRQVPYNPEAVRQMIKELGLLGYANFPRDYPRAPFKFVREGEGDQERAWIDFSALEEFESKWSEGDQG